MNNHVIFISSIEIQKVLSSTSVLETFSKVSGSSYEGKDVSRTGKRIKTRKLEIGFHSSSFQYSDIYIYVLRNFNPSISEVIFLHKELFPG